VIDTENGSASLYSGMAWCPPFDTLDLRPPYSPERFIEAIDSAEKAGYDIIIIDSATHEWNGSGGCLESNDALGAAKYKGNIWSAWNETTPKHRRFIDKMLQSSAHIIATMRSKTETAQQEVNGKKTVVKLGLKAEQRDGIEYEFTVVLDIVHEGHWAMASKDRTGLFSQPEVITKATGERLKEWLESGIDTETIEKQRLAAEIEKHRVAISWASSVEALREVWLAIPRELQPKLLDLKDERKAEIERIVRECESENATLPPPSVRQRGTKNNRLNNSEQKLA
jgi:hypothetical protein